MRQVYVELNRHVNFFSKKNNDNRHVNFFLIEGLPIKITSNMKDTYPKFKTFKCVLYFEKPSLSKNAFYEFCDPKVGMELCDTQLNHLVNVKHLHGTLNIF